MLGLQPVEAGEQHDCARAARTHLTCGLAHHEEGAAHIDAHDMLEVLDRGLEHRAARAQHAGAGDRDVHVAERTPRGLEGASTTVRSSPVSPSIASAQRPIRSMRSAAAAAAPGVQSSTATSAPRSARVSAVSRPMPEPPPVTNAVLP